MDISTPPAIAVALLSLVLSPAGSSGYNLQPENLDECGSFELVQRHALGPAPTLFGHVQGLEVTNQFFFITSITRNRESGFLYIYPRSGLPGRPPIAEHNLSKLAREVAHACGSLDNEPLNHPSGIYLEGDRLHVAVGPSINRGPSCVMTLVFRDLSAAELVRAIRIEEHIGALVPLEGDVLVGFNWASDDYWWLASDGSARRLPLREELRGHIEELLHIQDCDREGNLVYCTHSNEEDNLLKIYNVAAFAPDGATLKPRIIVIPPFGSRNGGTHEGVAVHEGRLFLLPDDGDETGVSVYELKRACGACASTTRGPPSPH